MCGRFTPAYTWTQIHAFLGVFGVPRNLRPRYNVAPTTAVDVLRLDREGRRELVSMRWGFVPNWWKRALKELPATFNARAETLATKSMFRDSDRRRRCVVPASGFFEWTGGSKERQPHFFSASDGSPVLAFAGLWDRWRDPATGEDLLSCTIVVTGASDWMSLYHDRMPAVLGPAEIEGWLDGSLSAQALGTATEVALREWLVDRRVNRSGEGDDDPATVAPLAATA